MDQIKIGAFIAARRKEKNLTQKELGDKVGVTYKSVSKWERGICLPDVSLFIPLCDILDIQLQELFAGEHISQEQTQEKLEENILPIIQKNTKIKKAKKIILIITFILIPLIFLQWHFKFYTQLINSYASYISLLYILAYTLIYKRIRLGYYLIWVIYFVLCFIYLIYSNNYVDWLFNSYSLDLWINILITLFAFIDKDIHYKRLLEKIN